MSIIEAKALTIISCTRHTPILIDINLTINKGEFIAILGHNGSGKSTLIKALAGHRILSSGTVLFKDQLLKQYSDKVRSNIILSLTQRAEQKLFVDMTLLENIKLWEARLPYIQRLKPEIILELTNNSAHYKNNLNNKISNLSGGEKQIFLMALIMAHPPELLFLDEHTSALDPKAAYEVMNLTYLTSKEHKITTIMITHRLKEALEFASRIIILKEGKIIADLANNAQINENSLKALM